MPQPVAFDHIETWIFDLDNTLYPASSNLFAEVARRMGDYIAKRYDLDRDSAHVMQKRYFREHGSTLRGLMVEHGQDPFEFMDYVHDIDLSPIPPRPRLRPALERLAGRKVIFTNGSKAHADRITRHLGVRDLFDDIFDIAEAEWIPKPAEPTYARMLRYFGVAPTAAAMIEDIAKNLKPAADLGITTVLISDDLEAATGDRPDFVHHVIDDLDSWLESLPAA